MKESDRKGAANPTSRAISRYAGRQIGKRIAAKLKNIHAKLRQRMHERIWGRLEDDDRTFTVNISMIRLIDAGS
jgi:hypothetical protein